MAAAAVAYVVAARHAPGDVLSFTRALAWPAVVALAVALFRGPVIELLRDSTLEEFAAGPARARFGRRQPQPDEAAALDPAIFGAIDNLEVERVQQAYVIEVVYALAQAYQIQLDFLRHLNLAPNGWTPEAAVRWFDERLRELHIENDDYSADTLIPWLLNAALIEYNADGAYVLSQRGRDLLSVVENGWYAPKLL
jgi:hypothetical protein